MIYAINRKTKEHRITKPATTWSGYDWELVEADADGWIEWSGERESPLPDYSVVLYHEGGEVCRSVARLTPWSHISAYKPILEPQAEQAKEWQPEVGDRVLVDIPGVLKTRAEVVAYHLDRPIVWTHSHMEYRPVAVDYLSPIRTDRERWIEAAMKAVSEADFTTDTYEAIYDAGLARLPGE